MASPTFAYSTPPADPAFTEVFKVVVPGPPVPKGRPRFNRRTGRVRTPKKTAQWERKARGFIVVENYGGVTRDEPLKVYVLSVKPRPKTVSRKSDHDGLIWCPKMPDGDNVMKAALDAAVKAGVMTDDNLVVRWNCDTVWAEKDGEPRVEITLYALTGAS